MASVSAAEFWTDLYTRGGDGWELRQPAPPLVDFVEHTPPPRGRVAVPGCGRGHDVRYLDAHGYAAVGFDFSPAAIAQARLLAKNERVPAEFVQQDIFTLDRDFGHAFDAAAAARRDLGDPGPGGYGLHLLDEVLDEVRRESSPGRGTRLHLVKYRSEENHG